jgi:hypothetical protein
VYFKVSVKMSAKMSALALPRRAWSLRGIVVDIEVVGQVGSRL